MRTEIQNRKIVDSASECFLNKTTDLSRCMVYDFILLSFE